MPKLPIIEPQMFMEKSIDQETLALNERIHQLLSKFPPIYTLSPKAIRAARERGEGLWPVRKMDEFAEWDIPGPAGDIPVRVYIPNEVRGVYMNLHGGGFMLGRAYHSDEECFKLANSCKVATLSVEYRLAPEHPFPAGLDDCEAVACWLTKHIKREFGTEVLLIGGESAGANLSVATMLRMRDRWGYTGFTGANLVYGGYDLCSTPSSRNFGEGRNLVLTTKIIEWFNENYTPREKWTDPYASPLYADLRNLPKVLFTVGTLDPLLDDSLFMYSRWVAAGNEAEIALYPGGIHAFNYFPTALAEKANYRMRTFIQGLLTGIEN